MSEFGRGDKVRLEGTVQDVSGEIIWVEGHGWVPSTGFTLVEKAKIKVKVGDVVPDFRKVGLPTWSVALNSNGLPMILQPDGDVINFIGSAVSRDQPATNGPHTIIHIPGL